MEVPLVGPVARLITSVEHVVSAIDEILEEFRGLRADVSGLDKQVRGLRSDVRSMSGEVVHISEGMHGIDGRMESLAESLSGVDALVGRFGRLAGRRRQQVSEGPVAEPAGGAEPEAA